MDQIERINSVQGNEFTRRQPVKYRDSRGPEKRCPKKLFLQDTYVYEDTRRIFNEPERMHQKLKAPRNERNAAASTAR